MSESFEFDAEVTCSRCDGDGGFEVVEGPDHERGGAITRRDDCRACKGKGTVTVHMRPIDFDDLGEVFHDD